MRWLLSFALLLVGLFLWNEWRTPPPAASPVVREFERPGPKPYPGPGRQRPTADPPESTPAQSGPAERVSIDQPRMQTLEGTVIVGFRNSDPVRNASGSFGIYTFVDQQDFNDRIEVRDGRFTTTLPVGGELKIWDLELDGKVAELEPGKLVPDANGRLLIRAFWPPVTRLRVRDALTGVELTGVKLLRREASGNGCRMLPTPSQRPLSLIEDGRSPIEIPGRQTTVEYWVGATGYAWRGFALYANIERSEARLQPAGKLLVDLTEYDSSWRAFVRVKRGQGLAGFDRAELQVELEGATRFEGLEPGSYAVTVEQGDWYNSTILGRTRATVVAGHQVRAVVPIRPPPAPESLVPVSGTMRVWPGEFYDNVRLSFTPLSEDLKTRQAGLSLRRSQMTRLEGRPSEHGWDLGRVVPGVYRLRVHPQVYEQEITVGPAGRQDIRIETPALHPVRIRPQRPADTQLELPRQLDLAWNKATAGPCRMRVPLDQQADEYATELPEGFVTLEISRLPSLWAEEVRWRIRPGVNLFEPVMRESCFLRIALFEAGRPVSVIPVWLWQIRARSVQNSHVQLPARYGSEGSQLRFLRDGPYRLIFPDLDGFQPIEPIEVFLVPGEIREISVSVVAR